MIIGICGKSGSGKSTLANKIIMLKIRCIHIDIDKVGHYVLTLPEVIKKLVDVFGVDILSGGCVDRKKLGRIVFAKKMKMDILANITWKYMQKIIDDLIIQNKDKTIILDWILLPKTKYFGMCNIKILLDIPYEERLKRVLARDNITEEDFKLRDSAGITYEKELFDYVVNSSSALLLKNWRQYND